jgi:hypothetical protein
MKSNRSNTHRTFRFVSNNRALLGAVTLVIGILFVLSMSFGPTSASTAKAASQEDQSGVSQEMLAYALNFKTASNFAVFGGHAVRNNGDSQFRGIVGSTGTIDGIAGMPDNFSDADYAQAKQDLLDAFSAIDQLPCTVLDDSSLGGKRFAPGVYCVSSAQLIGQMTVNANDDPNARFVFRIAGTFRANNGSGVVLENGASASNVYLMASESATVGGASTLDANLISRETVTVGTGATISGKTIGINGDVILTSSIVGAGTGRIEICKALSPNDPIPFGTIFTFSVAGSNYLVPAGGCSSPIEVAAGNVTVTEAVRANTAVISITTNPTDRLVSSSLSLRQAVVTVPEGDVTNQTVVTFTNQTTRTGTLEICKYPLDADVTGMFSFTVQGAPGQTFAVPVGFCSGPITVTILQVPDSVFTANVTELARPNYRLEDVRTLPADRLVQWFPNLGFNANGTAITNTNGGYANIRLISGGTTVEQTTVNFYNRSLPGRIKVCKITADPINLPVGTSFRFEVVGLAPTSPTQTTPGVITRVLVDVLAGPVGQNGFCQFVTGTFIVGQPVLITEIGLTPGQQLPPGITEAMIRTSRIRASTAFLPGFPDIFLARAAFLARNTTAEVEYTNFIYRPAILKLCKIAGTGVAVGTPFTFTLAPVNPLTTWPISTAPVTVLAGSCTFVNGPFPPVELFPGIGLFNYGTDIIVTEGAVTGTTVTAITSPTGGPLETDLPNRRGTMTLNHGLVPDSLFNEIAFTNTVLGPAPVEMAARYDFDGDNTSDVAIFRPSDSTWWYASSAAGGQIRAIRFGNADDRLVAADYDGDGVTDPAVYRNGQWHVLGSTRGYFTASFGLATDIPQTGDFDGDGNADLVVYRPSNGVWYMQLSRDGFNATQFGNSTDIPVAADFDGDGRMDPAVYRGGTWYMLGSTRGFSAVQFGIAGDIPVQADFDGDGSADAAVYRGGVWYILGSTDGYEAVQFGVATDTPVPADYDGDGRTDIAVYRSSTTVWHILRSSQVTSAIGSYTALQFGAAGDVLLDY